MKNYKSKGFPSNSGGIGSSLSPHQLKKKKKKKKRKKKRCQSWPPSDKTFLVCACNQNILWWNETKIAYDSQIMRAKENLTFSNGSSAKDKHQTPTNRWKLTPGTSLSLRPDLPARNLRGNYGFKPWLGLQLDMMTRAWYPCYIHVIRFEYLYELITKIRFPNNSFEFINKITITYWFQYTPLKKSL